ncbi:MAG: Maf family nucleotide pyrophosphatase [Bacteroidales bacterium]|nr:Maf family nucleotide pyrophosphatase [Bacteroidales bacterium]
MISLIEKIKKNNFEILLATSSPRRIELFNKLTIPFKVINSSPIDETINNNTKAHKIALLLAKKKAQPYSSLLKEKTILITADTIVCINNKIIGKPHNRESAIKMLKLLSNKVHEVYTGVNIKTINHEYSFYEKSLVYFNKLSDEDIIYYVDNYEPYDKAGSYGIQDWIGLIGIKKIEGCYYNVMGFPVSKFLIFLNKTIDTL